MRQIRLSIRAQLLMLVLSTALLSLLVLALVTGLYFASNLRTTSAEKLEVISQLKSSQLSQTYYYSYYQLYSLSTRDDIKSSLTNYKAGNTSSSVYSTGEELLQEYIDSTENFYYGALYTVDGEMLFDVQNDEVDDSGVSSEVISLLRPLNSSREIPAELTTDDVMMQGPVLNGTGSDEYLFSLTLPVYANSSILISTPDLAGYMTVIMSASTMQAIATDTAALNTASVNLIKVISSPSNTSELLGFTYAFEPYSIDTDEEVTQKLFKLQDYPYINKIVNGNVTVDSIKKIKTPLNQTVALGYSLVTIASDQWVVFVEQGEDDFLAPLNKLKKIIIGVVIGLAVFVCLVTFPLAHYGVRPIVRLQKATEELTFGKGLGYNSNSSTTTSQQHQYFGGRRARRRRFGGANSSTTANSSVIAGVTNRWRNIRFGSIYSFGSTSNINTQQNANTSQGTVYATGNTGVVSPSISDQGSSITQRGEHFAIPNRIEYKSKFIVDELSELTDAFNAMTDELDAQYTHLEDRVRERTRELEKAKIRAESADEAKTVFISQISHELRTPLNGILGLCSVCIAEDDSSTVKESLKLIFRSGELLLHILTELLTFSKNTLNKSKLENKDFKILEISWQIQSIFGKMAFDQNVDLRIMIKPNLLRKMILFGDSNRIIQVLMNLVSNSLKFTPVDGKVDVTMRCIGEYDEEKSKALDYKRVCIKNGKSVTDETYELAGDNDTSADYTNLDAEKIAELNNSNDNASDLQSLHTISTSEYSNAIFESQFQRKAVNTITGAEKTEGSSPTSTTDVASNSSSSSEINNEKILDPDESTATESDVLDVDDGYFFGENGNTKTQGIKQYKVRNLDEAKTWVMEFSVEDTGPGIEVGMQDRVFEPFIQGDQTLSRSHGGTGLGLSICRQLATMMRGTLELESTVGKGSRFIFRIPLPQVKELVVGSKKEEEDLYNDEFNRDSKKNRKVKIIEPNEDKNNKATTTGQEENSKSMTTSNSSSNLLKFSIPTSALTAAASSAAAAAAASSVGPTSAQLFAAANAQSPSASIETSSYFVDKPALLTKSSTGTAHTTATVTCDPQAQQQQSTGCALSHSGSDASSSRKISLGANSENTIDEELASTTPSSTMPINTTTTTTTTAPPPATTDSTNTAPQLKILVAEDNMVNQEVIRRMLCLEGLSNITMACDGQEAIELLQKQIDQGDNYDLIFMDIQMPKMDGVTATKVIRETIKYEQPIVALTAYADESNVTRCLESGMSGFLAKPIRRGQLKKILKKFAYGED